jgi:hypothetical protein
MPATGPAERRRRWSPAWLVLGPAAAWAVLVRVPLILNADSHLDSDLAVDGLTLLDATHGHWRWHYPGTPHIGTLPVLLSLPQALAFGANPRTLVGGGAAAYVVLLVATFVLARRAFGTSVALWGLVPLTFASTGTIWLSGRVTGGHVLAAAWHAGAFALLYECLAKGGRWRAAALGLWCGVGFWLDSMFLTTLAGLAIAAVLGWWASGRSRRGLGNALVFALAFLAGAWPHWVGARADPHNVYPDQFQPILRRELLVGHARLLALECVPRLIAGHRLPGLQSEPDPASLGGPGGARSKPDHSLPAAATTAVGLALFAMAMLTLALPGLCRGDPAANAVRWGLLGSAAVVVAGFVANRNIFNSDNYRYLVTLLVPWSIGFGMAMRGLSRRGAGGQSAAAMGSLVLAALMTLDTARWYARFGWIDARGRPVRSSWHDPALAWLEGHRAVDRVFGGYWDVYRLAFLTGGRVRGVPYPISPDRYPEWSRGGRPEVVIVRPQPSDVPFRDAALEAGGRVLHRERGLTIVSWPRSER